ncbi:galactose-1-phosphate uridylyltransferase [Haloechinothrix halophila]|uniref:galactose-1-phosphate uridylyltransferase n=1 Tax=Haloechinothrix halophila TaxID=1069073 RepID=UPI000426B717|nr:galactose-1-phosphate uridylyltransferase [Haloechinothrix halophila]
MKKTVARLADGRQLIYYDTTDGGKSRARPADSRQLSALTVGSELRFDPLVDEWVAIAAHRQDRTHLPDAAECPLCPSRDGALTEIPASDYEVVVFDNRFPSLSADVGELASAGEELVPRQPGIGHCEIVCFTSDHDSSFAQLTPARARTVLEAWADRTIELGLQPGIEQVVPFENRGVEIGVTLQHPHGQIYALPFAAPRTRRMLESARSYRRRTWRNLFADVLATERKAGTRIVAENEFWTAFVPAAARWPVEVHVYPHRQVPDLPALSEAERDAFCHIYLDLLRRLDRLYDTPLPYVAAWQQAMVNIDRDLSYLRLELFSIRRAEDKLKYLAAMESAMGVFLNDVRPEDVAQRLRDLGD